MLNANAILVCATCGVRSTPLDLANADGCCPVCGAAATNCAPAALPVAA